MFGFVLLEGGGDGLLHGHCLVEGMIGSSGNVRIGIESEHPAIAPGRFHQVKEHAAIGVLDAAGEGGRRHFRGFLAPGSGEVLVQDGQRTLVSARHLARHRQPVTRRLDIDEAGDAVLVIEGDVWRALLEGEAEIVSAGHVGDVREGHPHAFAGHALGKVLREEVVILLQRGPKAPARVEAIQDEAKAGAARKPRGVFRQPEIIGDEELPGAGMIDEAVLGRMVHVQAQRQAGTLVPDCGQGIERHLPVGTAAKADGVGKFPGAAR